MTELEHANQRITALEEAIRMALLYLDLGKVIKASIVLSTATRP